MKRAALFAFMGLSVVGMAQTRGSFWTVDGFSDVFLSISNGGLTYQLSLGAAPKITVDAVTYDIQDIFGMWALSNDDNLTSTITDQNGWEAHSNNASPGGIAGWKTNPNDGIYANQSLTFNFDALSVASVEQQGFHVRCFANIPRFGGNTGYATVVPEPSSLLALAVIVPLFLARRRK